MNGTAGPGGPSLAEELERILGGTASVIQGAIVVQRLRTLRVEIEGVPTRSPLVLPFFLSFEPVPDGGRNFLNLGETVLLTTEVNRFLSVLRAGDIEVTALHNHWFFTSPQIWYMHWQKVGPPIPFATTSARALATLRA